MPQINPLPRDILKLPIGVFMAHVNSRLNALIKVHNSVKSAVPVTSRSGGKSRRRRRTRRKRRSRKRRRRRRRRRTRR